MLIERQTHPFAVVRASELRRWVDSGAYTRLLGGDYPRRSGDEDADLTQAAQEAARHYAESFRQSQDALVKLMRDAGGVAASLRDWMGGFGAGGTTGEPPPA